MSFESYHRLSNRGLLDGNTEWDSRPENSGERMFFTLGMAILSLCLLGAVTYYQNSVAWAAQTEARSFVGTKKIVAVNCSFFCIRAQLVAEDGSSTIMTGQNPFHSEIFTRYMHGGKDVVPFVVVSNFSPTPLNRWPDMNSHDEESGNYLDMHLADGQFSYAKYYK